MRNMLHRIFVSTVPFPGFLLCLMLLNQAVLSVENLYNAATLPSRAWHGMIAVAWTTSLFISSINWSKSK